MVIWKKRFEVLSDSCDRDSCSVPVKEEECYYTNQKGYYKKDGSNKKGNNFGKPRSKLGTKWNIMRCHECDSTKHFSSNWPHRKVEETNMTVHITLVTRKDDSGTGSMLIEPLGKGILDSACTKTIYQVRNGSMNISKIEMKKTNWKFFVAKQKVNHCLDLVMVWKVRV